MSIVCQNAHLFFFLSTFFFSIGTKSKNCIVDLAETFFCSHTFSHCTSTAVTTYCDFHDGTKENVQDCLCGAMSCSSSTGLFCDASKGVSGQCAKTSKGPWIVVKKNGKCEDKSVHGALEITDSTKCSEAASMLGKGDGGAPKTKTDSTNPKGTFFFLF